jgi:hypothetical protein
MKDYTIGILRHRCSNLMRIGKPIRLYEYTYSRLRGKKPCPNCGRKIPILVAKK